MKEKISKLRSGIIHTLVTDLKEKYPDSNNEYTYNRKINQIKIILKKDLKHLGELTRDEEKYLIALLQSKFKFLSGENDYQFVNEIKDVIKEHQAELIGVPSAANESW